MAKLDWQPIEPDKKDWLYAASTEEQQRRGSIGHLRGDFGSQGTEFWTAWFDHQPQLKSAPFRREFDTVVNDLRKAGGLLHDFRTMRHECTSGTAFVDSFGFRAESAHYEYCLRCIPRRDDYHFYLYAFDKTAQREHERLSVKGQLTGPIPRAESTNNHKMKEMER